MTYNAFSYINFFSNMSINSNGDIDQSGVADELRFELNRYWIQGKYLDGKKWSDLDKTTGKVYKVIPSANRDYSSVTFEVSDFEKNNPMKRIEFVIISPNVNSSKWESSG